MQRLNLETKPAGTRATRRRLPIGTGGIKRGVALPSSIQFDLRFGAALLRHCGEEMNHLAQFLPELHAEFA